jgi:hypothetical protein
MRGDGTFFLYLMFSVGRLFASTGKGRKPTPREPSLAVGSKPVAPTSGQSEKTLTGAEQPFGTIVDA